MIMEWDWWWCPVCSACWQLYRTGPRENRRMMGEPLPSSSGPKIAEVLLSLADCPSVFLRDRPCGPVVCLDNGSAYVIPVMCSRLIDLLPFQSVTLSHVNLLFLSISIHFNLSLYSINSNHGTGRGRGGRGGGGGNACIMAFAGQSDPP